VTGANGHLGRRLLQQVCGPAAAGAPVRALVRSAAAAATLRALDLPARPEIVEVDYLDSAATSRALAGCERLVHLVGIIRESRGNLYRDAHERTAEALVRAAAASRVGRIVALGILGASPASANPCLRSRGAADEILRAAPCDVTVLRVPMVLGEDDFAARALAARARRRVGVTFRAASLEQPIYAGDVVAAILAALDGALPERKAPERKAPEREVVELAGPESLTRRALTKRAAAQLGRSTRVLSLPIGLGMAFAGLLERWLPDPPLTRAMLGVLDHDDCIDPRPGAERLGLTLTPLDETLRRVVGGSGGSAARR
jgi:NADH dehydrogenase